ncbi:hypothetical protein GCM10010211_27850 [Streptomyces albospinus]|uniref:AB hydrolase-1 domain-containing protein n=1 Tax=Streptomyces albospinus TaxID=285515 RepID=A0ABQ2UZ88_9ACTN|nr:hypothetical protein GCM10010211_27850 [Streptomyces albospinus]
MGARITAAVAARGKVAIGGSVLADPPISGPGRGPYPTSLDVFLGQLSQAERGTGADEVARSWPLAAPGAGVAGPPAVQLRAITATHRGFETEDFFDRWPSVPGPTALLYGADSPVVTAAGAARARALPPSAAFAAVPDAGHLIFRDNLPAAPAALRTALRPMVG